MRQSGKAALVAALMACASAGLAASPASGAEIVRTATTNVAEPVPTPGPGTPDCADGWSDQLLIILDLLCMYMGCVSSEPAVSASDVSGAINRLTLTVNTNGVAPLTGKDKADALTAAVQASVIADGHSASLGPANYVNLTGTLNSIIVALASGHAQ